jgi:putative phosphoesterase
MQAALDEFRRRGITVVLHPGDIVAPFAAKLLAAWSGTMHVTYGNNDGERRGLKQVLPQIQDGPLHLEFGGRRILLHHALEWCRPEDISAADVVVTGHSHEPVIARREGRLFVNPGECCGWVTGRATAAIIELDTCEAKLIEVPT